MGGAFFIWTFIVTLVFCFLGMATRPIDTAYAAGVPFPRGQGIVFVSQGSPTRLYQSVQTPGTNTANFFPIGSVQTITYNAMGLNPTDMYLYAINAATDRLIQIDSTGATYALGAVTGLPILTGSQTYNSGSIGNCTPLNTLWVSASSATSTIYGIDVAASPATATALHLTAGINMSSGTIPNLADFVCMDGYLWGVYGDGGNTAAYPNGMYRISITTGAVDWFSLAGLPSIQWNSSSFGAQWFYGNGNLGISNNATGRIYQIIINDPDTATPTFAEASVLFGPASTTNDGASYAGDPVDLSLIKTATTDYGPFGPDGDNDTYTPGSVITYTLTVTNNETNITSSGFYITDTMDAAIDPATITFDSSNCYISNTGSPAIVTCVYGTLAPGESATFNIYAITPTTIGGSIVNTATVFGNEADPNPTNDTALITSVASPSGYTVNKAVSAARHVRPGDTVTYTVTVTNTGTTAYANPDFATFSDDLSDILDDATLVLPLAAGLTLSGNILEWSGELAVGESIDVVYSVVVNNPVTGNQLLNNSVTATRDEGGCGGICSTQTLIGVPEYSITKSVDKTVARPGDFVTYTIAITNNGTSPFTASHPISITDDLSDVLDDAVFTGTINSPNGNASIQGTTLYWNGGALLGETLYITYTVRVVEASGGNGIMKNSVVPGDAEGICIICEVQTLVDTTVPPTEPEDPGPDAPDTGVFMKLFSHAVPTNQLFIITVVSSGLIGGLVWFIARRNRARQKS